MTQETRTVAALTISQTAFNEVSRLMLVAGYQHAFMPDGAIDMSGICIQPIVKKVVEHQHPFSRIAMIFADIAGVEPTDVFQDSRIDSYDLDSIDLVELVMAFEDELGIEIDDEEVMNVVYVRDILKIKSIAAVVKG